jgi:hypothetical protein
MGGDPRRVRREPGWKGGVQVKTLRYLPCLLLLSGVLRAQQLDNPVAVPISYYGQAFTAYPEYLTFSFGTELGATASATGNASPFYSNVVTGSMIPRKDYYVQVNKSGYFGGVVICHFLAVPEYDIYINGSPTYGIRGGSSFTFKIRLEPRINDFTSSLAGKRGGECSNIAEDKPFWFVGLGAMRNGRFAGGVGFRANTITSSLYNTSSLIYDSIDTSEVNVTRDGNGYITAVQSRDVKLEMENDPNGTSYYIRAYSLVSDNWSLFITYTIKQFGTNGVQVIKNENSGYLATALEWDSTNSRWTWWDWRTCDSATTACATTT